MSEEDEKFENVKTKKKTKDEFKKVAKLMVPCPPYSEGDDPD